MNLSTLRRKKNISQEELAASLGVTQGAISAYETGRWEPSIATIKKMASILDCTVDELLEDPEGTMADVSAKLEAELKDFGLIEDDDTEFINFDECF